MKKVLLPAALVVAGVGAGVGAGFVLRPEPGAADHGAAEGHEESDGEEHGGEARVENASQAAQPSHEKVADAHRGSGSGGGGGDEYVRLGNQFIVPILEEARVRSLVVLSIDLEVGPAGAATVYRVEPKIRDAFLTVLFDHANAGGFNGTFTSSGSMEILRKALREAGRKAVGDNVVSDVLITGIVRQDV